MSSGAALQARLKQMAQDWVSGAPSEPPITTLERSLARFDLEQPAIAAALDVLIERWREIMPSLESCRAEILAPAFERLPIMPSAITAGLTLSAPASERALLSLGWAERRWREDGKLAAKIRVSAFFDSAGRLYWDFGVAGRSPPPLASLRRGVEAAAHVATVYNASLDLTPSHEKAAWLALRLGGRPSDRAAYIEALRQGRWADVRHNAMSFTA